MKYYIATAILLLAATLVEFKAKGIASEAPRRLAQLSQLDEQERNIARQHLNVQDIIRRARLIEAVAGVCCLVGIVCWIISRKKKEKGTQVVPIVLMASYVLMVLILI